MAPLYCALVQESIPIGDVKLDSDLGTRHRHQVGPELEIVGAATADGHGFGAQPEVPAVGGNNLLDPAQSQTTPPAGPPGLAPDCGCKIGLGIGS